MTDVVTGVDWRLVKRLQADVGGKRQAASDRALAAGEPELAGEDERQFVKSLINDVVMAHESTLVEAGGRGLDWETRAGLERALEARLFGAGSLQQLLEDDQVEDIAINGWRKVFVEYADGSTALLPPVCGSNAELIEEIRGFASGGDGALSGRAFDVVNPRVNLRLHDGSRLYALMEVSKEPVVSIRKHRHLKAKLADLKETGTLTDELIEFLSAAIRARLNFMISGSTKAGKTTLLRALATEIDPTERLITVERSLELGLDEDEKAHPNCIALEERHANAEGVGHEPLAVLVRDSLRLNPSRVIVGEVLGDEVITMLNAMTQGNDGSLSTIHANSAHDVIEKITTYAAQAPERLPREAVNRLIASGLNFIVHMRVFKTATGQVRLPTSIVEITGLNDAGDVRTTELFQLDRTSMRVIRTPYQPTALTDERLRSSGWTDGGAAAQGWV